MKRIPLFLCVFLFLTGTAFAIPFQVTNSTLNVNWNTGSGLVYYTGYSMPSPIDLAIGQSTNFTFGQVFFPFANGSGTANLNIQFDSPLFVDPVQNHASFSVWSLLIISGGKLTFGAPTSFAYNYNGTPGIMTLDLFDLSGIQWGSWAKIKGTITNAPTTAAAPVPEPATLLLVGIGLIGIAGIGRANRQK